MRGFKFFIVAGIFSLITNFMSFVFIFSPSSQNMKELMPFLTAFSSLLFIIATIIMISALVSEITEKEVDKKKKVSNKEED